MATRIELAENDRDGRVEALPEDVAAALADSGLVDVRPEGGGFWRLTPPTNKVGAMRVGEVDVVVQPKAPFASLLFMLGYARDPGFVPDEFTGSVEKDLWPLVGETLDRLARAAVLRGVLQGYVTRDDSLAVLKGRLRVADQIARRPGLVVPVEVRYDEYETDIPENQILRTAMHRLSLVPRMPSDLRRRLVHLSARLEGARLLPPGSPVPAWQRSRLNERYVPALRLAEVVLRTAGLGTSHAGQPVASFVVNMATVFEDFVTVALREAFARISTGRTDGQYRTYLDVDSQVPIRPDIVHLQHGRPVAVVDAKYKLATDDAGYPTADLYQMHAYCTVLALSTGHLVYASSSDRKVRTLESHIRNSRTKLVAWPLDVSKGPQTLISTIGTFARCVLAPRLQWRPRSI